ncbi:MAG: acid--CoA ligase [Candidatus Aminicenantaceae bacterium]
MAGIYRQRHPEHTVFYRVFFHYFELTFEAERLPPPHQVQQELLMAAEEKEEYF